MMSGGGGGARVDAVTLIVVVLSVGAVGMCIGIRTRHLCFRGENSSGRARR